MDSRGGVTGGPTIEDFHHAYEREGFTGEFIVRPGGRLECCRCHVSLPARSVKVSSLRRVEGVSDPADMTAIAALQCPSCDGRGVATFTFGPMVPADEAEVLRQLDHGGRASRILMGPDDPSLVRDTGWIDRHRERT